MKQTTGQTLLVDEARLEDNVTSVNPCPDHEKLGDEVEASTAEIHGYLQKYETIKRLNLPLKVEQTTERSVSTSGYAW